ALEIAVLDGVVFYMRRQMLDPRVQRRTFGHCPGLQNTIDRQPEIVMQPGGVVPLHAEIIGTVFARDLGGSGFGRVLEPAFGGILFERHKSLESFCLHHIGLCSILKTGSVCRAGPCPAGSVLWHLASGRATSHSAWFPSRFASLAPPEAKPSASIVCIKTTIPASSK